MTTVSTKKTMARPEARTSPEIKSLLLKSLLQKAPDLEGLAPTAFVIASVQVPTIATIQKNQTFKKLRTFRKSQILKLSLEDSEAFVDALLNPPLPNEALLAAAVRYKQTMSA
jgi:uncharacterized protein (DUF1778 family)